MDSLIYFNSLDNINWFKTYIIELYDIEKNRALSLF